MIKERGMKRQVVGTVVSDKMDKTVTVLVERLVNIGRIRSMSDAAPNLQLMIHTTLVK